MAANIRIGIIGCGANMAGHVRRLLTMDEVEIVGLADPSVASVARLVERNPALAHTPTYRTHTDLLHAQQPDAVEISTPHTLHFEHIMDALEAGSHVLTEKPMVCRVDHAHQVIDRARELHKVLLVSYQRHYSPLFRYVKHAIASGQLGEIQFVTGLQNQNWYRFTKGKWRSQLTLSGGGQLNDSGSHLLDIILWTTDLAVDTVYCGQERFDGEVDINSAVALTFTNGALGTISVVGHAPADMWEDITWYGSKGAIYFRTPAERGQRPVLVHREFGSNEDLPLGDLPPASSPEVNFVDAIRGRDVVHSPGTCGLRVIELTEAAWESAQSGRPVKVRQRAAAAA
jgi:predicted dehydrogenase